MSDFFKKFIPSRRDAVMCSILIAASVILSFIPPYNNEPSPGTKEKAQVISVDNSAVMNMGLLRRGSQLLDVKILSGKYKGQIFRASNELRANMELDKLFAEKDIILVGIIVFAAVSMITTGNKFDAAGELREQGDYAAAKEIYIGLNYYKDSDVLALYCEAMLLSQSGNDGDAVAVLERCPVESPMVFYHLARCAALNGG